MKLSEMKFAHLHQHDEYSLLDGAGKVEDVIARAKELKFTHLAQTNHGNIDGAIVFAKKCKEVGIIPIIGCELYVVEDMKKRGKERRLHAVWLCKNNDGFESLMRVLTKANLEGFYYRPRADAALLRKEFDDNSILLTGCSSGILNEEWGRSLIIDLNMNTKTENTFIELMPFNAKDGINYFKDAIVFAKRYDLKTVVTNDAHYINKEDWEFHEALLAMSSKKRKNDPTRWKFGKEYRGELYLKSKREMWESCINSEVFNGNKKLIIDSMNNTGLIAEECGKFELKPRQIILPKLFENDDKELGRICKIRMKEMGFEGNEKYEERLNLELDRLIKLGFSRVFLIVADYVNWAKEQGILVGPGRGSVGNSLAAYLMKITVVDPIKYNLIFDRFISEGRIDQPDIDMDFEDSKRHMVEEHLIDKYGEKHVACVSTFLECRGKQALRDASRYEDVPLIEVNKVAKEFIHRSGGDARSEFTCADSFDVFESAKDFKKKYPSAADTALKLEGRIKTVGRHAAGWTLSANDLSLGENCVLVDRKGKQTINWDKKNMEFMGLLKFDILGLSTLSILREARDYVKSKTGKFIDFYKMKYDDEFSKRVYGEFNKGNTVGIFQMNTKGPQQLCREVGIENFKDLYDVNALYRPGTLRSGLVHRYIARKKGLEKKPKICKQFDELTKDTQGIILYQEQVMILLYKLAGMSWQTADTVRKVISKSQGAEAFKKWKDDFVNGCEKKKTLNREQASKLYDELVSFSSYAFVQGHSIEYAMIAYWTMYMKIKYPLEFFCALLNHEGDPDNRTAAIRDAERLGLKIEPPDIRYSSENWAIRYPDSIVAPLTIVKGVGKVGIKKILELRDEEPKTFNRIDGYGIIPYLINNGLGKGIIQPLIKIGAFDSFKIDGKKLIDNWDDHKKDKYKIEINDKLERSGFSIKEREENIQKLIQFEALGKGSTIIQTLRDILNKGLDPSLESIGDCLKTITEIKARG